MKNLLLADVHLRDENLPIIETLFREIADECSRRDIHRIFILGDFFHDRRKLSVRTLISAYTIADILRQFQTYIIVGNHDSLYKNKVEPTSLEIFEEYENIHIIKSINAIENIVMVPWIWIDDVLGINSYRDDSKDLHVFGHFDFKGFKMNNTYRSKDGTEPSSMSSFKRVYTGHFHTPSKQGNIQYLGSPIQHTFHDEGSPRGYYVFDNEEDTIEFVEFTDAPKFVTINTEYGIDKYDIEGNIVRVKFDKDYGTKKNNEIIESIQSRNPLKMRTDTSKFVSEEIEQDDENEEVVDNVDLLKKYVDIVDFKKYPDTLSKKFVLKIIDNIDREIKNG